MNSKKSIPANYSSMNETTKIESNDKIRKRIKELQKNHKPKLTDLQVSDYLGISVYVYKNIISGKNKTISTQIIKDLRALYNCSFDYILGESFAPNLNRDGSKYISPINFDIRNQQLTDVSKFLQSNYQTLNNLHMLLYKLPPTFRDDILKSFNSFCENIRITCLIDRKDELTSSQFKYIFDNLVGDNPELTVMTLKLAEANAHKSKKRKLQALHLYLEIIYHGTIQSRSAVNNAILSVKALHRGWNNFPSQLKTLINFLPSQNQVMTGIFELPPKVEDGIYAYFQSQKIDIETRQEYLNNLKW